MSHIVEIMEKADDKTLVLLDEIGAGTDPDQGAALGMAILEDLTERGTLTVTTTHYGSLKAFAHNRSGIENACMEFDSKTLQPTYHLLMGVPGSSKAFEIAKRLGLPKDITVSAAKHLGAEELEIGDLISHLQEQSRIIREKREAIEDREAELEDILEEREQQMANIKKETDQIKKEALEEAEQIVNDSNALIEKTIQNLREKQASKESIEEAKEELNQEKEKIQKSLQKFKQKSKPKPVLSPSVGDKVKIDRFDREGIVESEPDKNGNVKVAMGNIHFEVHQGELSPPSEQEKKQTITTADLAQDFKLELDLRGLTFDEAEIRIEKYFDEALIAGINTVRLIHGKGTGALRRKVRNMLNHHSLVKEHHLADYNAGGSGVTVVELVE
jgi:DNA mismatch repair protein MutS2